MIKKLYYWLHTMTSREDERNEYSSGHWQDRIRRTALSACTETEGQIVEIGCGEGLFLKTLTAENGASAITGLDIRHDLLISAKQRTEGSHCGLIQADAGNMPLAANVFDAVICINVLFNLPSFEKVRETFCEISRISKPGSIFVFDIRNSLNPLLRVKYGLAKYYDDTVRDLPLMTYRVSQVESLLRENGFEQTKCTRIGFPGGAIAPIAVIEARKH